MNTILEKADNMKASILRFGVQARAVVREVCTFEFLGLATMLLPALMASVGFFFGKTVSPVYFWSAVAILTCAAFLVGWRRGLAYLALLAVCTVLTMYTFSYRLGDSEPYHFPMQYLLHHGWNPVFDSTIEKLRAITAGMHVGLYHVLFLPKFTELCSATAASGLHLFVGDGFLGYGLAICLFATCMKFSRRFWMLGFPFNALFACVVVLAGKPTHIIGGQLVDYAAYAALCVSMLALVLYVRDSRLSDLSTFAVSACICMTSKTTGILCSGILVILTMPLLYRRIGYWHTLLLIGVVVAIVGASPLLTNWIQYGSPFYPSMTFDPKVAPIDITCDFTGNADALSMGYLSRICYAWISPKLTISALRFVRGDSDFSPVFGVYGGVAGMGAMFRTLLLTSVVLLCVSRKNLVTWLCFVIFVSANFAPLKYIGYNRYFPQISMIIPLAAMNFVCTVRSEESAGLKKCFRRSIVFLLSVFLVGWSGLSLARTLGYQVKTMADERLLQDQIATLPRGKPIATDGQEYRLTTVARLAQSGLRVVWTPDGETDESMRKVTVDYGRNEMYGELYGIYTTKCFKTFPTRKIARELISNSRWSDLFYLFPHVLWDDNARKDSR